MPQPVASKHCCARIRRSCHCTCWCRLWSRRLPGLSSVAELGAEIVDLHLKLLQWSRRRLQFDRSCARPPRELTAVHHGEGGIVRPPPMDGSEPVPKTPGTISARLNNVPVHQWHLKHVGHLDRSADLLRWSSRRGWPGRPPRRIQQPRRRPTPGPWVVVVFNIHFDVVDYQPLEACLFSAQTIDGRRELSDKKRAPVGLRSDRDRTRRSVLQWQ